MSVGAAPITFGQEALLSSGVKLGTMRTTDVWLMEKIGSFRMVDAFDRTFIAAFVQLDPAAVLPASGRVQFVDGRFGTVRWMIKHPPYLVLVNQVDGEPDPSMSLASQVVFVDMAPRQVAVALVALAVPGSGG